jgi:hypothetical protein
MISPVGEPGRPTATQPSNVKVFEDHRDNSLEYHFRPNRSTYEPRSESNAGGVEGKKFLRFFDSQNGFHPLLL